MDNLTEHIYKIILSQALTFAFFALFGHFRESLCLWKF